jgi:tetratricopeptide (TPR) repeat protein
MKFFLLLCALFSFHAYSDDTVEDVREKVYNQYKKASIHKENGEYDEAIRCLDYVIAQQEEALSRQFANRANCYHQLGEYVKAEVEYRKAIPFGKDGYAEYMVGNCLFEQEKYAEANDMYSIALEKQPDGARRRIKFLYKYNYAMSFFMLADKDKAVELFETLAVEFPEEDMETVVRWAKCKRNNKESIDHKNQADEPVSILIETHNFLHHHMEI